MAYVRLHLTLVDIWEGKIGGIFVSVCVLEQMVSLSLYVCVCLCLTYTLVILHLIARGADTSEGSVQILTSSWRAGAGHTHTLIDICGEWDQ